MNLLSKVSGLAPLDGAPSAFSGGHESPLAELTSNVLETLRSVGIVVGYLAGRYGDDRPPADPAD